MQPWYENSFHFKALDGCKMARVRDICFLYKEGSQSRNIVIWSQLLIVFINNIKIFY